VRFDPDANADKVEAGTQEQAGKNHTRAFLELNARELHPWACSVNQHPRRAVGARTQPIAVPLKCFAARHATASGSPIREEFGR
jgi:hypothetical protein